MIWQEIRVKTTREAVDLVSDVFLELGFSGVVIEDPQLILERINTSGWDHYEFPPEVLHGDQVTVKAYLPKPGEGEADRGWSRRLEDLRARLAALWGEKEAQGRVSLHEVREEDWAEAWKRFYRPIRVLDRLIVVPAWEGYRPEPGELVIELDPGMAFGTGQHPTTLHCLKALAGRVKPGDSIIDIGTGSGVLAIAAAKLGASRVLAIDVDPLAVKIAEENFRKNRVEDRIQVSTGDLLAGAGPGEAAGYDLIVANIIADTIKRLGPQAYSFIKPGGCFIGAGIIRERLDEVLAVLKETGFSVEEINETGEWSTVVMRKAA
ncbi:MAG: 50S ribosomal protein L11 methyltransferase [Firmicutes bacterium]|nr:50S ribosomal protein L11 methyltransferase [Bacillota bacterium]